MDIFLMCRKAHCDLGHAPRAAFLCNGMNKNKAV